MKRKFLILLLSCLFFSAFSETNDSELEYEKLTLDLADVFL